MLKSQSGLNQFFAPLRFFFSPQSGSSFACSSSLCYCNLGAFCYKKRSLRPFEVPASYWSRRLRVFRIHLWWRDPFLTWLVQKRAVGGCGVLRSVAGTCRCVSKGEGDRIRSAKSTKQDLKWILRQETWLDFIPKMGNQNTDCKGASGSEFPYLSGSVSWNSFLLSHWIF